MRPTVTKTLLAALVTCSMTGMQAQTSPTVQPNIAVDTISASTVYEVHLRPLYTTTIHLPEAVSSVAVGAPTLFMAEHDKNEPRLVFVKPSTHLAAQSNLFIALESGKTISIKLNSAGDGGSPVPVDFVVNYDQPHSLLSIAPDAADGPQTAQQFNPASAPARESVLTRITNPSLAPMDLALNNQMVVAVPRYLFGADMEKVIRLDRMASDQFGVALGALTQDGENMTLAYSVLNKCDQWIQVLPPQIQLANPLATKISPKHPPPQAMLVVVQNYRVTAVKLAPHQRLDGVLQFARPNFKRSKEALLLQIATSASADAPLLIPVPFVAPEN